MGGAEDGTAGNQQNEIYANLSMSSKKFLIWFAYEYLPFRKAEIDAICSMFNVVPNWIEKIADEPYAVFDSCTESDVSKIMSRSVLAKSAFELWASAKTREELFEQIKMSPYTYLPENKGIDRSFKILVESFNKKISKKIQIEKIEQMDFLPFEGPIKLTDPDNTFCLFEYYGLNSSDVREEPYRLFFGKWLQNGQRRVIHDTNLQKRKFISNTTMNPALSLLMSNIAKVKNGDVVLDPFVGSGSILVAAAHFGGYVMGTDIDYRLLYGLSRSTRAGVSKRAPDESVYMNLKQYGLDSQYLDVLVGDASLSRYRPDFKFDAVLCDPPYGIREQSVQIGTEKEICAIPSHLVAMHVPSKVHYNLQDIINDLLNFSAEHLKNGGRLAFWMPVFKDDVGDSTSRTIPEPRHCCLRLVSTSEEWLSAQTSRLLVCMEKYRELSECTEEEENSVGLSDLSVKNFRENFYNSVRERIGKKKLPTLG